MKKFLGLFLFIILFFTGRCEAAQFNILVLPTNIFLEYQNFMVFPNSAEIIASDIINYYNINPKMSAPTISHIKNVLNQSQNFSLKKSTQVMFGKYNSNYTINYDTIQRLANKFRTRQVLLISCNLDTQNYVLRRTFWDFLNIPGATVVDPAYRLSTQVTLIDANNQIVLWQENYQKLISSREARIIPEGFSPASEQLEKVKKYSTKFIAPQVVQETQLALMNISPYQNLNLRPEIVKPQAISIDKAKIDAKRASVRSGRYIKKQSIKAAKTTKKETKKFVEKQKENIKLRAKQRQERKELKLEAKKKAQELKAQQKLEKEKLKQENNANKVEQKQQSKIKNIFNRNQQNEQDTIQTPKVEVVPSSTIMQQNLKPVPYIRTKPVIRDIDYTINDI
ncbi:MAG: hypothetical protein ACI4SM_04445 [Candidatus Gastranaerophilaceae bacterium]